MLESHGKGFIRVGKKGEWLEHKPWDIRSVRRLRAIGEAVRRRRRQKAARTRKRLHCAVACRSKECTPHRRFSLLPAGLSVPLRLHMKGKSVGMPALREAQHTSESLLRGVECWNLGCGLCRLGLFWLGCWVLGWRRTSDKK